MTLSPDAKERLGVVFSVVKTAFHWGFIPTVLYLGKHNFTFKFSMQSKRDILTSTFFYAGFKKGAESGHPPLSVFRYEFHCKFTMHYNSN